MNDIIYDIFNWIRADFKSNKIRFVFEVLAWIMSIGCSFVMMMTVPNPPLNYLYIPWLASTGIYAVCAMTRRSFGMLANYLLLFTFDSIAFIKLWL